MMSMSVSEVRDSLEPGESSRIYSLVAPKSILTVSVKALTLSLSSASRG